MYGAGFLLGVAGVPVLILLLVLLDVQEPRLALSLLFSLLFVPGLLIWRLKGLFGLAMLDGALYGAFFLVLAITAPRGTSLALVLIIALVFFVPIRALLGVFLESERSR